MPPRPVQSHRIGDPGRDRDNDNLMESIFKAGVAQRGGGCQYTPRSCGNMKVVKKDASCRWGWHIVTSVWALGHLLLTRFCFHPACFFRPASIPPNLSRLYGHRGQHLNIIKKARLIQPSCLLSSHSARKFVFDWFNDIVLRPKHVGF